jgi:TonB family protein
MTELIMSSASNLRRAHDPAIKLACGLIGIFVCGCTSPSFPAIEGSPMPKRQVAAFLKVATPSSAYDTAPKFVNGYAPFYPEDQAQTRKQGYAVIAFNVTEDGTTSDVRLLLVTDYAFGQEAVIAVQSWRFTPAQKNGRPVKVRAQIPFTFHA